MKTSLSKSRLLAASVAAGMLLSGCVSFPKPEDQLRYTNQAEKEAYISSVNANCLMEAKKDPASDFAKHAPYACSCFARRSAETMTVKEKPLGGALENKDAMVDHVIRATLYCAKMLGSV